LPQHRIPRICDEREKELGATRSLELLCRGEQIARGKVIALEINSGITVDLGIEQSRGDPGFFLAGRGIHRFATCEQSIVPNQVQRLARAEVPADDGAIVHAST